MLKGFVAAQNFVYARLHRDDRGATAVEYGLIVALIAAVVAITATTLGGAISGMFGKVAGWFTTPPPGG